MTGGAPDSGKFQALWRRCNRVMLNGCETKGDPMAYNSGTGLASLAGVIGGGIGAYLGYNQGLVTEGISPVQGALIMGAIGLVVGSAGAFILKSLMQFIVYIIMFALLAYIFRGQIEALTGVNPVTALEITLGNFGLNVDLSPD